MRKRIFGIVAAMMLAAPNMVLAQEQAETPEVDPAGNQQPAPPAYPPAYPPQDGAGGVPQYQAQPQGEYQAQPPGEYQPPQNQYQPVPPAQPYYGGGSPFYQNAPQNYGALFGAPPSYTGYSSQPSYSGYPAQFGPPGAMLHPRVATAPAGLTINVTLQTAISTQVAKEGDFVQAQISQNVALSGLSYIPQGSIITGQISEAQAGRMMNRSGSLGVQFNKLQLPDGESVAIQAHVLGDIGKYQQKSDGEYHGEGWGAKLGNFALRSAIGAGGGAALGTAMGAITGGGIGTGAWAGTAIGGGIGALDSIFLRRGKNVLIQSGTPMQIQLDAPVQVPVEIQPQYGAS